MAKKKVSSLGWILVLVGVVLGVLSVIWIALPGLTKSESGWVNTTASAPLYSLIFGNVVLDTTVGSTSTSLTLGGGLAYFGLIGFILLVVGMLLGIVGKVAGKKLVILISGVLLVLAGVCMFLLPVAGTGVGQGDVTVDFTDSFNGYGLGVGAILFGLCSILGGLSYVIAGVVEK